MPQHLVDGWVLDDFEHIDGVGYFTYERVDPETKVTEVCICQRAQPVLPGQPEWRAQRDVPPQIFGLFA